MCCPRVYYYMVYRKESYSHLVYIYTSSPASRIFIWATQCLNDGGFQRSHLSLKPPRGPTQTFFFLSQPARFFDPAHKRIELNGQFLLSFAPFLKRKTLCVTSENHMGSNLHSFLIIAHTCDRKNSSCAQPNAI